MLAIINVQRIDTETVQPAYEGGRSWEHVSVRFKIETSRDPSKIYTHRWNYEGDDPFLEELTRELKIETRKILVAENVRPFSLTIDLDEPAYPTRGESVNV